MEFFTVFYIEYAIMGREIKTYITLPSSEACQIFIRDNEDMDQYMNADGDVNMWCLDTGVMSESIRPKLRPEGEQWETSRWIAKSAAESILALSKKRGGHKVRA